MVTIAPVRGIGSTKELAITYSIDPPFVRQADQRYDIKHYHLVILSLPESRFCGGVGRRVAQLEGQPKSRV